MKIIKTKNVPKSETPHKVDVRKLYSFPHATFVHISLQQGESLKKHITPVDATFYILQGRGKVEIGEEVAEVEAGDLIFSPLKIVHRLFNENPEDFKFLVIKTPSPKNQPTKIL